MNSTLPIDIIASALIVFSTDLNMMKIGAFILGLFHLKTSCSFTHAVELVPDKYKTRTTILINTIYFSIVVITGLFYLFISADTDHFYTCYFCFGGVASVLYMIFIPESPYWLVRNEGSSSLKAIESLNYIAKFNGSDKRISKDTILVINNKDKEMPCEISQKKGLTDIFRGIK